ncbi:MAG: hypothetical protein IPJ69_03120 [Deltaproteobacteria bacterium]|nr:MAG: hypothetical protein IPJ69_03120 [Deltaproteobacteria bacterium]
MKKVPFVTIYIKWDDQKKLVCDIVEDGCLINHSIYHYDQFEIESLCCWIVASLKKFLYHQDFAEIKYEMIVDNTIPQDALKSAHVSRVLIERSQNTILQFQHLSKTFSSLTGHLFYNADSLNTFEELFYEVKPLFPNAHYENYDTGWNKENRTWDKGKGFSLAQLLDHMLKIKARHFVTVNMYYLNYLMMTEGILLLPIFKAIGLECIIMDYDTYELAINGLAQKASYTCDSFRRFSVMPSLISKFDLLFENSNVRYFMIGKADNPEKMPKVENQNLKTIIITQSRAAHIIENFSETLFFLELVDPQNPYQDFQDLYYCLLQVLFHDKNKSRNDIENIFEQLSKLHLTVLSFMKFDVIHHLYSQGIKAELYGDSLWNHFFPQIFQNKFLNEPEIEALFQRNDSLYLLLNQNYSYFENNPAFLRAINLNAPYLTFPSVIKAPDLKGLSLLEYSNGAQLIEKIKKLPYLIQEKEFQQSFKTLKNKITLCRQDLYKSLEDIEDRNSETFEKITYNNNQILSEYLSAYAQRNKKRVTLAYQAITQKQASLFPIDTSRYRHLPYFQKLKTFYEENQEFLKPQSPAL